MRNLVVLSVMVAALGAGFAAVGSDYSVLAREVQIQRNPSAEILKQHALYQASVERALEQPALPARTDRRNEPVAFYFKANLSA